LFDIVCSSFRAQARGRVLKDSLGVPRYVGHRYPFVAQPGNDFSSDSRDTFVKCTGRVADLPVRSYPLSDWTAARSIKRHVN
ncbi:MAG: hypothetical protein ACR2HI_11765, partial [Gaiella sp.]